MQNDCFQKQRGVMRKHICVVTATRAEYGLLSPIIKKLEKDKEIGKRKGRNR